MNALRAGLAALAVLTSVVCIAQAPSTETKLGTPMRVVDLADPAKLLAGYDARALYSALASIPKKDQFETTAEAQARMEAAVTKLTGASGDARLLAFTIPPDGLRFKYDADKEVMLMNGADVTIDTVTIERVVQPGRTYTATTTGGAAVEVKTNQIQAWDLELQKPGRCIAYRPAPIPLGRAQARDALEGARAIVVGRLVAPFVSFEKFVGRPTFKDPRESVAEVHRVHIKLEHIAVLAPLSGAMQVLARDDFLPAPQASGTLITERAIECQVARR